MEDENKRILRCVRVCTVLLALLLAVSVVTAAVVVPPALRALSHAADTLSRVDTLSETAEAALTAANAAAESANRLVADNADAISDAMTKINAIDFDALNKAINDLADIVEPLARVSNFFNR